MGMEITLTPSSALTQGLPGFLRMTFPGSYGMSGPMLLPVHPKTLQIFIHFNVYALHEPHANSTVPTVKNYPC